VRRRQLGGYCNRGAWRAFPTICSTQALACTRAQMLYVHKFLFSAMWISWAAYWWLASLTAKTTERKEPVGSRLQHVLPLLAAAWLLWAEKVPAPLNQRLFPWAPWQFWVAALITAIGLAFAVWARLDLGGNWSGTVTIKQDHELIATGSYAYVRHPIYTGLLVALLGTAMARGEWRGVLAVCVAWAALWRKLRIEEQWMIGRFGNKYIAYRQRVPALLPFSNWRKS
jgi:protein-S-isoprenylcysteine O-methyltransferase Ste14